MKQRAARKSRDHRYAVIMAGGTGTRLWPVSRTQKPKQFQSILGERSLLQKMHSLLAKSFNESHIFVQIPAAFLPFVREQLPRLRKDNILIEPAARDTGPAFAFAAMSLRSRDPEAVVGFYYSDHMVQSERAFATAIQESFKTVAKFPNHLVLVGVEPLYPHTGLGYIEMGKPIGEVKSRAHAVRAFIEKPDLRRAKRFVASKKHLWNTGYKVGRAAYIIELMSGANSVYREKLPALAVALRGKNSKKVRTIFNALPKQSFEYAFTERDEKLLVIASDMIWSDVGDWGAIDDALLERGGASVRTVGSVVEHGSNNVLLVSNHRPVVAIGLKDLVVVETADAVLVMSKHKSAEMKQALEKLRARHPEVL